MSDLFGSVQRLASIMEGGREEEHCMCQRVIIMEHVFGTFNGFWGYRNPELNFSMPDTPTACYMSKVHRLAREKQNEQERRTVESFLADCRAILHEGNSSCTLRGNLAVAGLKKGLCCFVRVCVLHCGPVVLLE